MITSARNFVTLVASREIHISQTLGDSIHAEPGRGEGSEEGVLFGVANHLIEGRYEVDVEEVAILGVSHRKAGSVGKRQIASVSIVQIGAWVNRSIVALRAVFSSSFASSCIGCETEVNLHVDWQHHSCSRVASCSLPLNLVSRWGCRLVISFQIWAWASWWSWCTDCLNLSEVRIWETIAQQIDEEVVVDDIFVGSWAPRTAET